MQNNRNNLQVSAKEGRIPRDRARPKVWKLQGGKLWCNFRENSTNYTDNVIQLKFIKQLKCSGLLTG